MSVDHLYFVWWMDPEHNEPWVRHQCRTDGHVEEYRLPQHLGGWRLNRVGSPIPSFHCERCDAHIFLYDVDRVAPPEENIGAAGASSATHAEAGKASTATGTGERLGPQFGEDSYDYEAHDDDGLQEISPQVSRTGDLEAL